jgi:peptidoglycan/xylan/chitin deacetylase (PgdA/CDA1 family)
MPLKHRLKGALREGYARLLFHTGLHRLVNRLAPRRLTILFGHCIADPQINGFLPDDMKMEESTLRRVLAWFQGHGYGLTNVQSGVAELSRSPRGPSLVALTMDDGYLDNRTRLLPILEDFGASATVFLESRPLDERGVNWSHKYHWVIQDGDVAGFVRRYLAIANDEPAKAKLRAALEQGGPKLAYRAKLVFKYDAEPRDRDASIQRIFAEAGGVERALCEQLYLDWARAKELAAAGIELGGHTVSHVILSRLSPEEQAAEIGGCRRSLERQLGERTGRTFAYPFGRSWDFDQHSRRAATECGFELAVDTHNGTNEAGADRLALKRVPVDDRTPLHLLVAEACGGFALLRRLGLNLSE